MFADKYLAGLEQIEVSLLRVAEISRDKARKSDGRHLMTVYIMWCVATLSTVLKAVVEVLRNNWLPRTSGYTYPMKRVPCMSVETGRFEPQNSPMKSFGCGQFSNLKILISSKDGSIMHPLQDGDTFIVTESSRLADPKSCQVRFVVLPDSNQYPKMGIRIRMQDGTILSSKLIFNSTGGSASPRPQLYRRFGTDVIPIKLSENINVLTDTVMISEQVLVSFQQLASTPIRQSL